ncbi:ribbon-helix-helix domain-containing protein [SAR116 cluster bacterium]|nr:ribbon-helix-helix domain-containing protein [SAR116 cluster bacterium]
MSLLKKSFTIGNHRTSISLEPEFWDALEIKANEWDVSLSKLVLKIDNEKPKDYNNLASYIRVWVLKKIG